MNLGTAYFPNEILFSVAELSCMKEIQTLRLTCKTLEAIASHYLIRSRSLWISPAVADQKKMLGFTKNPVICQTIIEIRYDASWSIREEPAKSVPFTRKRYVDHFCGDRATRALGFKVSRPAATRGYKHYEKRKNEEDALAKEFTGPNLTRDHDSLPDQFSILLQQPQRHHEVLNYLPSDLATLIKSLPHMPNIRHFVVSDCRYSRTHNYCNLYSGFENWDYCKDWNYLYRPAKRGLDEFVLKPRPWRSNTEEYIPEPYRQIYRGFPVMMQAASMMGMIGIESFSIERDSDDSGISCDLLDMSPTELHHSLRAFSSLRNLRLKINTQSGHALSDLRGTRFRDVVRTGTIAKVCMAAVGLEALDIQLDGIDMMEVQAGYVRPVTTVALEKLIGKSTWSKLTSVTLGWMKITKDDFLAFYNRQRHTLRRLNLNGVTLTSEPGASETDREPRRPWEDAFRAMAAGGGKLQYFKVDDDPQQEPGQPLYYPTHFELEDQAAILCFLDSGGIDGNWLRPHGPGC